MTKNSRLFSLLAAFCAVALVTPALAFAEAGVGEGGGLMAIGIGLTTGLAVFGGGLGQGKAISSGLEAIGRNPGAQAKVLVAMLVGLAFIEALVLIAIFVTASGILAKI
jgi:F-type H+-transporting ATPase subunit c